MRNSLEWHIRAQQSVVLEVLQDYWWERGCSVEILDGSQDASVWVQLENAAWEDLAGDLLLISATDVAGWSIVWPMKTMEWDEELLRSLSWETRAPILAGQFNHMTFISQWAYFERGKLRASQWRNPDEKTASFQLEQHTQPDACLSIQEAFSASGRIYWGLSDKKPDLSRCKRVVICCGEASHRRYEGWRH